MMHYVCDEDLSHQKDKLEKNEGTFYRDATLLIKEPRRSRFTICHDGD